MQKTSLYKWLVLLGLLVALVLSTSYFAPAEARPSLLADPPANQVAVKLKSWVSINTILTRYNATQLGVITETNLYLLQLPSGETADQILPTMNADTDLWYAEPNYYSDSTPDSTGIGIRGTGIGIRGTGEITPTPGGNGTPWEWTKTGLADAQKISTGQGVIVAVLDTGLAADHPLLQSNLTTGYDFVHMTGTFLDAPNGLDDDGDGLVDEDFGHGTHVAGIIVTYAPGVQIMPIRVLNSDGVGTYWEVSQGIYYAVDHGAKVINMSLTAPRLTASMSDALAYAAAHGVIVVAAAGNDDAGPNYPAGYSDPLAVIGVGASDQNDAKASFSGGLVSDTDVFAPGVDIYSSYRYNGFGLGTGTSMAAPIVAAEAAMLIARHPSWSAAEIEQRIVSQGATVSGSSAKRVDLAAALSTGVEVDHATADLGASPTDQWVLPRLRLFNNTTSDIPLSELKLRYWYTVDTSQSETFNCDYASYAFGCPSSNVVGAFPTIATNSPNRTNLSDTYIETGFNSSAGNLAAGSQLVMYLRAFKTDLSNFNEVNDYSYDPNGADMTRWDRVTVYRNGVLIWGVEPTGSTILTSTPTRTATLAPTGTITRTPLPTNTFTRTPTAGAFTLTPTKTLTPAANTATRTMTPTSAAITATFTKTPTPPAITATRTNTPLPPTATSSGGSCTVITGSGSYPITTSATCFKYVNTGYVHGGIFTVANGSTSAVNTVNWYGGFGENATSCANNVQTLNGNGAQLNNFSISRDANGAMFLTITGSAANTISISILQNWQNGAGCSVTPTPGP
ncbi:MAG: S8 family serine peptidase [Anaerolineales bacterium]